MKPWQTRVKERNPKGLLLELTSTTIVRSSNLNSLEISFILTSLYNPRLRTDSWVRLIFREEQILDHEMRYEAHYGSSMIRPELLLSNSFSDGNNVGRVGWPFALTSNRHFDIITFMFSVYVYIVQFVFCITGLKPLLVALRPIQRYGTGNA